MKKGLRSVLFSVLVGALLLCAGCGKSGDIYTAGVYTASAEGYSGPVTVEVEFDGSSILENGRSKPGNERIHKCFPVRIR